MNAQMKHTNLVSHPFYLCEDVATQPNETFIYKVGHTIPTLKFHCAIVTFRFKRGVCGTPQCKLDVAC